MKTLMTPAQLTKRYHGLVSEKTLANWRAARKGPKATKIGGATFYAVEDVEKYEAQARKKSARRAGISPGLRSTRSLRGSKGAGAKAGRPASPRSTKARR